MTSYGIESGSQRILDNMNKRMSISSAVEACLRTKEAGIALRCTISVGHPGENVKSIRETIVLLCRIGYFIHCYP